tara:strand:- start:13752 stop:13907 length:156 start_codon:yes stop_codon:yes gene_type:complete
MFQVIFWEGVDIVEIVEFDDARSALKYKERALRNYKLGSVTVHDLYNKSKI